MLDETGLIAAQQDLEARTLEAGIARFEERTIREAARVGFDKTRDVQKLIKGATPILAEGIAEWLETTAQAKGRKPTSYQALAELDPAVSALIGTTALFRYLGRGGRITDIVYFIGSRIEIELEGAAIEAEDPKAASRFLKLAEGNITEGVLMERFRRLVEHHEAALNWSTTTKVLVGQTVLNVALVKLKDLFVTTQVRESGKSSFAAIELTNEASEVLVGMQDASALQHLPLLPMVSKPRTWEGMHSGAYYDFRLSRLVPMVRTRSKEHKRLLKEAIADGTMQPVLHALNAIQDTRWAIDTRVLRMVRWVRDGGHRTKKSFPANEQPPLPEKVDPEAWAAMSREERTARSRKRRSIALMRTSIAVDKRTFDQDLGVAEMLAEYEAFYMPHSLDFRGRTYAVPYFNHQRSDHLKGLFRFADGVPLGEHGGEELMIHLANTGDFNKVSKKSFEERIAWVNENASLIMAAARNPEDFYFWWSQADSPFCFLQACFEYNEWAESAFSKDFVSTIPGAADGSCSGLQHYSLITRSESEAYHVNLVTRPDVGDIYRVVADVAVPTLQAAASRDVPADDSKGLLEKLAASTILENGFGRSEVKRNVMTYFYGSARFGMRDQHMKDLMQPLADEVAMGLRESHPYSLLTERVNKETGEVTWAHDGGFSCASVMAGHVFAAVTTVAAKADEAARWIQSVAAILAHESLSMIWRTQTGLPVVQRYSEYTSKMVNLWLYDRGILVPSGTDRVDAEGNALARVQLLIRQAPTTRVDKKTMRNASSPNVIHSMDAAHLHLSVVRAKEVGIEAFSMIHDSFGTHLGNMRRFGQVIREALIECYQEYCPLEELDRYARSVLSEEGQEKLPPLPAKGTLDLQAVREARYAFA